MLESSRKRLQIVIGISRTYLRFEVVKCLQVSRSFAKDRDPTQSCLRAFQAKHFEEFAVIVFGDAPFVVMVLDVEGIGAGPGTSVFHGTEYTAHELIHGLYEIEKPANEFAGFSCAEGGSRTPTLVKAHAPETCVSTSSTTSAHTVKYWIIVYCSDLEFRSKFRLKNFTAYTLTHIQCLNITINRRACKDDTFFGNPVVKIGGQVLTWGIEKRAQLGHPNSPLRSLERRG